MRSSLRSFVAVGLLVGMGLLSIGTTTAEARHRSHRHHHHHHRGIGINLGFGRISVGIGSTPSYARPYPVYSRPYAVYSQPYSTYAVPYQVYPSAPTAPGVITYKGKGLVLWNADTNSQPVTFSVDGQNCTLQPGYQITLTAKPSWTVAFERGNGMQPVRLTIEDGQSYTFQHSDSGWDLNMTSS